MASDYPVFRSLQSKENDASRVYFGRFNKYDYGIYNTYWEFGEDQQIITPIMKPIVDWN